MNENPSNWQRLGLLCVVSGPSGSGKTTLCQRFAESDSLAEYAVSATTRPPRSGEVDGKDYFFLTREDFEQRIRGNEFIEFAEVHGNYYGTLKSEVMAHLTNGRDVLIDIDVQGAELIRQLRDGIILEAMIDLFILPADGEELLTRLKNRGTETEEQLKLRLSNARQEMTHWTEYEYTIISGSKDEDFTTFSSIIHAERCRTSRYASLQA